MQTQSLISFSDATQALAAASAPHVVSVSTRRSRASGFFWKDGLIVTAEEALPDGHDVTVSLAGGVEVKATVQGRDPSTDVALLKIEAGLDRGPLPKPATASLGGLAIAVGRDGSDATVAMGLVSKAGAPWESLRGGKIDARIELDFMLRRRLEGSLVLAADGGMIGMAVSGPRRRTLVIPAATIARVAAQLETDGRIPRGYLGLGLEPVRLAKGEGRGAMIMSVDENGPGHAAGLMQGDIIVAVGGEALAGHRPIPRNLGPGSVGQTLALGVVRGGARRDVTLTIGERPAA